MPWLLLLASLLLLSACSMVRIGYSMAPTLINWELSRYVTFTDQQQGLVDETLASLHEWHRRTQLPVYVALLEDAADRLLDDRPLRAAELARFRERVFAQWEPIAGQLAPGMARILVTMTPDQFDQIQAVQRQRHQERLEERASDDDVSRTRARLERWEKRFTGFLGPLTELQQARLAHGVADLSDTRYWMQGRPERQQRSMKLMRELAVSAMAPEKISAQIEQWFVSGWQQSGPEHQEKVTRMLRESDDLTVRIFNLGTPKQRDHARQMLLGYAQQFRAAAGL